MFHNQLIKPARKHHRFTYLLEPKMDELSPIKQKILVFCVLIQATMSVLTLCAVLYKSFHPRNNGINAPTAAATAAKAPMIPPQNEIR